MFATYRPKKGQTISNLLSRGIVKEDGTPGKNFNLAAQRIAQNKGEYAPTPDIVGAYGALPQPYAWGAFGQRKDIPDARFPADLPNGPFQITKYVSYGTHTGDPLHRFFQMWQQVDGGKNDLFVWTAESAGVGPSNGKSPVALRQDLSGRRGHGFLQHGDRATRPIFASLPMNMRLPTTTTSPSWAARRRIIWR